MGGGSPGASPVHAPPAPPRRPAIALRETAGGYRQHDPRETVLCGLVAEHLEPFLAEVREQHERGLPDYVEQELRAYLECGIRAFGFGRVRDRHPPVPAPARRPSSGHPAIRPVAPSYSWQKQSRVP